MSAGQPRSARGASARAGRRGSGLLVELALALVVLVGVLPIAWTVLLAFLPNRAIVSSSWQFPFWLGNFREVLGDDAFLAQIGNSATIVVGSVLICLVIGSAGGYGIAKLAPPRWVLVPSVVLAAVIPLVPPATLVPGFYVVLGELGLLGTTTGLVLLNALANLPFAMLLMATYFTGVPDELREASLVDGASELRSFVSVSLPVVRPGLAAVAIFVAIMSWNEFLLGLTMTSGGRTAPITVGIAGLLQPYAVTWGQLSAAGTVAAVPIIALAVFANRHIVAGLTAGAVKG